MDISAIRDAISSLPPLQRGQNRYRQYTDAKDILFRQFFLPQERDFITKELVKRYGI